MAGGEVRDRWGSYQLLTGREAPGHCFWCGAEVKNRRFCDGPRTGPYQLSPCALQYWSSFCWPFASVLCWERAGGKCEKCGTPTPHQQRRTHHIQPLNGHPRGWSVLNRQENLMALCTHHHGLTHASMAREERGQAELERWREWATA